MPKLNEIAKIGLTTLGSTFRQYGVKPPPIANRAGVNVTEKVKHAVKQESWRDVFDTEGGFDPDKKYLKQEFQKAKRGLVAAGVVVVEGGWVWIAGSLILNRHGIKGTDFRPLVEK